MCVCVCVCKMKPNLASSPLSQVKLKKKFIRQETANKNQINHLSSQVTQQDFFSSLFLEKKHLFDDRCISVHVPLFLLLTPCKNETPCANRISSFLPPLRSGGKEMSPLSRRTKGNSLSLSPSLPLFSRIYGQGILARWVGGRELRALSPLSLGSKEALPPLLHNGRRRRMDLLLP